MFDLYSEEFLENYHGTLTEEDFDLISFSHSYEKYISNRNYFYATDSDEFPQFCVELRNDHLPHLLALSKKHHSNLPEYQAQKVFSHLKKNWDIKFLKESDPIYFNEFELRILGIIYLYQVFRLINCRVLVPLPKAIRMKKMNIGFLISPKNSKTTLYTVELVSNGVMKDNVPIYYPQSMRVNDTKVSIETREIEASLIRVDNYKPKKKPQKKKGKYKSK